jgi:hypothetical protein
MGGERDFIWHIFKNVILGRKIQFNFQNDWINQSMTGPYNQYLLPFTLAAFLERSFSKIVLFSALSIVFYVNYFGLSTPLLFETFYYNKEFNQCNALHMKECVFFNPYMHFTSLCSLL